MAADEEDKNLRIYAAQEDLFLLGLLEEKGLVVALRHSPRTDEQLSTLRSLAMLFHGSTRFVETVRQQLGEHNSTEGSCASRQALGDHL